MKVIKNIIDWIMCLGFIRKIKCFIQRGIRGYSNEDLWSFDYYLSGVIANGLKDLKKMAHGYPGELESMEEWQGILDKIIDGFDYYHKNQFEVGNKEEIDEMYKRLNKSFDLFKKWFSGLWD